MKEVKDKKVFRRGCMQCPGNEDVLAMDTVLYNGFGGYHVKKDKKFYWAGDPQGKWESFPTLRKFENLARKEKGTWEIVLDNPLRGATWRRKGNDEWVLTETNLGFA